MDFIMLYRLLECMREGLCPDMDVYDAAAWSAPGPLSGRRWPMAAPRRNSPILRAGRWKEP